MVVNVNINKNRLSQAWVWVNVYISTQSCAKISYLRILTIMRPVTDSQALFVLLKRPRVEQFVTRSSEAVNPELCSEGMQKRCAVRLRCTKSDIFSHLLQPQTIPAHKNYCHVPKIEDAPISRVKPLACEKLGCRSGGRNVTATPSGRRTGRNHLLLFCQTEPDRYRVYSADTTTDISELKMLILIYRLMITDLLSNTSNTDM